MSKELLIFSLVNTKVIISSLISSSETNFITLIVGCLNCGVGFEKECEKKFQDEISYVYSNTYPQGNLSTIERALKFVVICSSFTSRELVNTLAMVLKDIEKIEIMGSSADMTRASSLSCKSEQVAVKSTNQTKKSHQKVIPSNNWILSRVQPDTSRQVLEHDMDNYKQRMLRILDIFNLLTR